MDNSFVATTLRGRLFQGIGFVLFAIILSGVALVFAFQPAVKDQFQSTYTKVEANPVGEELVRERTFISKRSNRLVRYVVSEFEYDGAARTGLAKSDEVFIGQPTSAWVQDNAGELTLHYTERTGASNFTLLVAGAAAIILLAVWLWTISIFVDRSRLAKRSKNPEEWDLLIEVHSEEARRVDDSEGDEPLNLEIKRRGVVTESRVKGINVGEEFKIESPVLASPKQVADSVLAVAFTKKGTKSGDALVFARESKVVWPAYVGQTVAFIDNPVA